MGGARSVVRIALCSVSPALRAPPLPAQNTMRTTLLACATDSERKARKLFDSL